MKTKENLIKKKKDTHLQNNMGNYLHTFNIWMTLSPLSNQIYLYSPSLKPQTASNAGVEARWLGKTPWKGKNLGRNLERNQAMRGGQSSSGCAWWRSQWL